MENNYFFMFYIERDSCIDFTLKAYWNCTTSTCAICNKRTKDVPSRIHMNLLPCNTGGATFSAHFSHDNYFISIHFSWRNNTNSFVNIICVKKHEPFYSIKFEMLFRNSPSIKKIIDIFFEWNLLHAWPCLIG
jgi:hypothetical protein